ncbi:hypothetical protein PVAP13_6NG196103 [Panicum virgatum]|uniref:Uncharacterized protein n=1 Tax=Panicum virgatum TaxID=38727 RepID=A0A8T0QXF8_PANVG|nr:hypothetical protein PVAP13_6NG196103 [Panicum virgatum]
MPPRWRRRPPCCGACQGTSGDLYSFFYTPWREAWEDPVATCVPEER